MQHEREWEQSMPLRLLLSAKLDEHEKYAQGYFSGVTSAAKKMRVVNTVEEILLRMMEEREYMEIHIGNVERGEFYRGYTAGLTFAIELIRTTKGTAHGNTTDSPR